MCEVLGGAAINSNRLALSEFPQLQFHSMSYRLFEKGVGEKGGGGGGRGEGAKLKQWLSIDVPLHLHMYML